MGPEGGVGMPGIFRKLFLLLTVTAFVLCPVLYAAPLASTDFTIGIFSLESTGIDARDFVLETGRTYCTMSAESSDSYLIARLQARTDKETETAIHRAYVKENSAEVQEVKEKLSAEVVQESIGSIPIVYKPLETNDGLQGILNAGQEGLDWYCLANGLDALLLVSSRKISGYSRVIVAYYSRQTKQRSNIFDTLVLDQNLHQFQEDLAIALLRATGRSGIAAISFDNAPVGMEVLANGKPLALVSAKAFVPSGTYELVISAFGHVGKTLVVEVGVNATIHVDASLSSQMYDNLALTSKSGNASWFLDGNPLGFSTGIVLQEYSLPLVIAVAKEGFALQAVQTRKIQNSIAFDLKPLWMDDTNLIGEAKKTFYGSLQGTIFLFGLYVACATLSDTPGFESQLWQPVLVATSGFTLVSSVNLIKSLASYAFLARTSNR